MHSNTLCSTLNRSSDPAAEEDKRGQGSCPDSRVPAQPHQARCLPLKPRCSVGGALQVDGMRSPRVMMREQAEITRMPMVFDVLMGARQQEILIDD